MKPRHHRGAAADRNNLKDRKYSSYASLAAGLVTPEELDQISLAIKEEK